MSDMKYDGQPAYSDTPICDHGSGGLIDDELVILHEDLEKMDRRDGADGAGRNRQPTGNDDVELIR